MITPNSDRRIVPYALNGANRKEANPPYVTRDTAIPSIHATPANTPLIMFFSMFTTKAMNEGMRGKKHGESEENKPKMNAKGRDDGNNVFSFQCCV